MIFIDHRKLECLENSYAKLAGCGSSPGLISLLGFKEIKSESEIRKPRPHIHTTFLLLIRTITWNFERLLTHLHANPEPSYHDTSYRSGPFILCVFISLDNGQVRWSNQEIGRFLRTVSSGNSSKSWIHNYKLACASHPTRKCTDQLECVKWTSVLFFPATWCCWYFCPCLWAML